MPPLNEPLQLNEVGSYGDLMARPNPDSLVVLTVPAFESMLPYLAQQAGRELSPAEVEAEHQKAPSIVLTKDSAEKMAAARAKRGSDPSPQATSTQPNPSLERTGQGGGVWSRLRRWFAP